MRLALITAVSLFLTPSAHAGGALGGYRFGMTPEEVQKVPGCGPYRPIGKGDVECGAFELGGKKRNLSFHFFDGKLGRIQVWFAESAARADAEPAVDDLVAFLGKTFGELESNALSGGAAVTRVELFKALDAQPATNGPAKVQLKPKKGPEGAFVFASIIYDPRVGHYVFLYYAQPRAQ